mgnify:CR=1 FL=1
MTEKRIIFDYEVLSFNELSEELQRVASAAKEMTKKAYAPYSGFMVGAAVLLDNGVVVTGTNQENVAYPSGLCAERVALFSANANYPDNAPVALAIAAFTDGRFTDFPVTPCGSCRQVMIEIEKRFRKSFEVLMCFEGGVLRVKKAGDLMPLAFDF